VKRTREGEEKTTTSAVLVIAEWNGMAIYDKQSNWQTIKPVSVFNGCCAQFNSVHRVYVKRDH